MIQMMQQREQLPQSQQLKFISKNAKSIFKEFEADDTEDELDLDLTCKATEVSNFCTV